MERPSSLAYPQPHFSTVVNGLLSLQHDCLLFGILPKEQEVKASKKYVEVYVGTVNPNQGPTARKVCRSLLIDDRTSPEGLR
jgi:hypothetical protein